METHLALHPLATAEELETVRADERAKSRNSTPYFDFTVSATKSMSVLTPPDPKRQAALNSVDAALAAAAEVQTEVTQRDAPRQAYMLQ